MYQQQVNYTFHRGSCQSYIDHILIPEYISDTVTNCEILHNHSDNLSDHYAISLNMDLLNS